MEQPSANPEVIRIAAFYVTIIIAIVATAATIVGSIAFLEHPLGKPRLSAIWSGAPVSFN